MTDNVSASQPLHSVSVASSPQLTPTRQLSADPGALEPSPTIMSSTLPLLHWAINLWHPSDTEQESLLPSVPPCSLRLPCVLWTFYGVNQAKQTCRLQTGLERCLLLILFLKCLVSKSVNPFFFLESPFFLPSLASSVSLFTSLFWLWKSLQSDVVVLGAGPEVKKFCFKYLQGSSCLFSP